MRRHFSDEAAASASNSSLYSSLPAVGAGGDLPKWTRRAAMALVRQSLSAGAREQINGNAMPSCRLVEL